MSQFSRISIDQARVAKEDLKEMLKRDFADASLVGGIGLRRVSTSEWGLKVDLQREPSVEEKPRLPEQHLGVKVVYEVRGIPKKAL